MFTKTLKTAAILGFVTLIGTGTTAQAGQSCWGLEGQALKDCIAKMVKDICEAGGGGGTCGSQHDRQNLAKLVASGAVTRDSSPRQIQAALTQIKR